MNPGRTEKTKIKLSTLWIVLMFKPPPAWQLARERLYGKQEVTGSILVGWKVAYDSWSPYASSAPAVDLTCTLAGSRLC